MARAKTWLLTPPHWYGGSRCSGRPRGRAAGPRQRAIAGCPRPRCRRRAAGRAGPARWPPPKLGVPHHPRSAQLRAKPAGESSLAGCTAISGRRFHKSSTSAQLLAASLRRSGQSENGAIQGTGARGDAALAKRAWQAPGDPLCPLVLGVSPPRHCTPACPSRSRRRPPLQIGTALFGFEQRCSQLREKAHLVVDHPGLQARHRRFHFQPRLAPPARHRSDCSGSGGGPVNVRPWHFAGASALYLLLPH
jgi:hypothetical protein